MKMSGRYRAISIKPPARVHFRTRVAQGSRTVVMPAGAHERWAADLAAFVEWRSDLDRAYDVLAFPVVEAP